MRWILGPALIFSVVQFASASEPTDSAVNAVFPQVVQWRRDLHAHPELSNRETRTSEVIAKHLRSLGLQVKTGIAHTGVAALIHGGRPGPTIALRADMDALPVTEQNDLPFRSTATSQFRGETVGVMHACGHDAHVAMLMGVAQVMVGMRERLPGNVLLIFQPAEEGPPEGERGGAKMMLDEGLFGTDKPKAVFGVHVISSLPTGVIGYRAGPMMAGSDRFTIKVTGRQTHGSRPWSGVDPIVAAANIVTQLQTIVSRQIDLTATPVVLSIGAIKGGIRFNIIPEDVEMIGTLRTFDDQVREDVIARMRRTVENTAAAQGARAEVAFDADVAIPPLINDPALTQRALPTLRKVAGEQNVREITLQTPADDFSFFSREVPGLYVWIGVTPANQDPSAAPFNHSPRFVIDEEGMRTGIRTLLALTLDSLAH